MTSQTPRIDSLENRNYVINGGFDFWQRGTTITTGNNGVYLADRWRNFKSAGGTVTQSRDTDTPTLAQSGFKSLYSHLYTMTAAQSVAYSCGIVYCMEGYDYANFHGRTARLQFWVKSSIAGAYSFAFNVESINRTYIVPYTINAANTWEQKSIDVTFESSAGVFLDSRRDLLLVWNLGNTNAPAATNQWQSGGLVGTGEVQWSTNAGATFKLAQVMLTPVTAPSTSILPFSRAGRTVGDELALCQRYYEKSYDVNSAPGTVAESYSTLTSQISGSVSSTHTTAFSVTKRSTPTVVFYTADGSPSGSLTFRSAGGVETERTITAVPYTTGFRFNTTALYTETWAYGNYTAESEL